MTKLALLSILIISGTITSIIFPVLLPVSMLSAVDTFISYLFLWNGILPIVTIFNCLSFLVFFEIAIGIYKLFQWALNK